MSRIMNKKPGVKDRFKLFFSAYKAIIIALLLLATHVAVAVYVGNAGYNIGYVDGQEHVRFTVFQSEKVKELTAEVDRLQQETLNLTFENHDNSEDSLLKTRRLHKKLMDCRKELKVAGEFEKVFIKSFKEYNKTAK